MIFGYGYKRSFFVTEVLNPLDYQDRPKQGRLYSKITNMEALWIGVSNSQFDTIAPDRIDPSSSISMRISASYKQRFCAQYW